MKKIITLVMVFVVFVSLTGVAHAGLTIDAPDVGSTSALMGIALAGLAVVRRFVR
jgi:VPDSG-CTERM motif